MPQTNTAPALLPPPRKIRRRSGTRGPFWAGLPLAVGYVVITALLIGKLATSVQTIMQVPLLSGRVTQHLTTGGQQWLSVTWKQGDSLRTSTDRVSDSDYQHIADGAPAQILDLSPPVVILPGHSLWNRIWPLASICVLWTLMVGYLVFQLIGVPFRQRYLLRYGKAVTGDIVDSSKIRVGRQEVYRIKYRFTPPGGTPIDATTQISPATWQRLRTDRPVTVLYARNPHRNAIYETSDYEVQP